MNSSDFVRIRRKGPGNIKEALWLFLFYEGVESVPTEYHLALMRFDMDCAKREIGQLFYPAIKKMIDAFKGLSE